MDVTYDLETDKQTAIKNIENIKSKLDEMSSIVSNLDMTYPNMSNEIQTLDETLVPEISDFKQNLLDSKYQSQIADQKFNVVGGGKTKRKHRRGKKTRRNNKRKTARRFRRTRK